ncbi:type VI secretion system baseplate subunit TssE [Photobacterium sanguinicancri]|uniref:type VI secretion system baseplate subunit TssE n=1 Tax=Photobacterium sanguinicancri TaxID=875932 RepID=UPI0026E2B64B|nr:type VI secretion system baseplate subunit TssE [Photobacterium sanguinicancri]MDO6498417.1 type VI secretion system baseplate subunit TssE [Photobacterium sanguinicancri]
MYVPLKPSLLDNLIDDTPEITTEQPITYSLQALKDSVRRDIEWLLNSRRSWLTWSKHLEELDISVMNYGLPDFSAMPFSSSDGRNYLCRIVEETITRFEPRFDAVFVTVLEDGAPEDRVLRLRIQAIFRVGTEQEELIFDSEVEPVSLGIKVEES